MITGGQWLLEKVIPFSFLDDHEHIQPPPMIINYCGQCTILFSKSLQFLQFDTRIFPFSNEFLLETFHFWERMSASPSTCQHEGTFGIEQEISRSLSLGQETFNQSHIFWNFYRISSIFQFIHFFWLLFSSLRGYCNWILLKFLRDFPFQIFNFLFFFLMILLFILLILEVFIFKLKSDESVYRKQFFS